MQTTVQFLHAIKAYGYKLKSNCKEFRQYYGRHLLTIEIIYHLRIVLVWFIMTVSYS